MKYMQPLKLYKEWRSIKRERICELAGFHVDHEYVKVAMRNSDRDEHPEFNWPRRKNNTGLILDKAQTFISRYNVMGLVVNDPCIRNTNIPDDPPSKILIDQMSKSGKFEGLKYTYWPTSFLSQPEEHLDCRFNDIKKVSPWRTDEEFEVDYIADLMLEGFTECGKMSNEADEVVLDGLLGGNCTIVSLRI